MNIKVCGINSMKEMQQLDGMDIDFAGIVFDPQSRYFVGEKLDGPSLREADLDIRKVGIFINATEDHIMDMIDEYGLDMVQLEGNETTDFCKKIANETAVVKTFFIDGLTTEAIDSMIAPFDDSCDYYAFDTVVKKDFSGIAPEFDWKALSAARIEKPFFIGGGIRPEDVALVTRFKHPDLFGVDLNCYFDKEPGIKDMGQVLKFKHALKQLSV